MGVWISYIILDVEFGSDFRATGELAIKLANECNALVEFTFNGWDYVVHKDDKIDTLYQIFLHDHKGGKHD